MQDELTIEITSVTSKEYYKWVTTLMFKFQKKIFIYLAIMAVFEFIGIYYYQMYRIFLYFDLIFIFLVCLAQIAGCKSYIKKAQNAIVSINENEFRSYEGDVHVGTSWLMVKRVINEPDFIGITLIKGHKIIFIPKRCFSSKSEAEKFFQKAEQYWKQAKATQN